LRISPDNIGAPDDRAAPTGIGAPDDRGAPGSLVDVDRGAPDDRIAPDHALIPHQPLTANGRPWIRCSGEPPFPRRSRGVDGSAEIDGALRIQRAGALPEHVVFDPRIVVDPDRR